MAISVIEILAKKGIPVVPQPPILPWSESVQLFGSQN